jgi:prevent-host-death family protein
MTSMPAGRFKDQCLKVLDRVAEEKTPITITKRGRPVATLVPYSATRKNTASLVGSVLRECGNPYGTGDAWDADLP